MIPSTLYDLLHSFFFLFIFYFFAVMKTRMNEYYIRLLLELLWIGSATLIESNVFYEKILNDTVKLHTHTHSSLFVVFYLMKGDAG